MGKEISTLPELNQFEAINHKSQIRMWLHDVVDGVITPGLLTVENLIAGVTLGLDELYSASDHDHDSRYYNKYLRFAGCNWVGNMPTPTPPTQRTINFIPAIMPNIIIIMAYWVSDTTQGFLGVWWMELIQSIYYFRGHPTYHNAGISPNCFYSAPTAGSFILNDFAYNVSGFNYQALILGKSE